MAKLYWLKTIQPCKLELHPLKDYAGMPLIFTTPGTAFARRCVTEEVRFSSAVKMYLDRQMIAEDNRGVTPTPAAVTAVVKPTTVAPVPSPAPAPVVVSPPVVEPAKVTVTLEDAAPQIEETLVAVETDATEPEPSTETSRRGKRGRGRY